MLHSRHLIVPAVLAGALLLSSCGDRPASGDGLPAGPDGQQLFIGDSIAVVNTSAGRVRGYILRGVYTYLGIPYAASAAGENRFMPPQAVEPWDDIRPAVFYGNVAPQRVDGKYTNSYSTFTDHWNYYGVGEEASPTATPSSRTATTGRISAATATWSSSL